MINSIGVHIKVKDFEKSEKFYKALGFELSFAFEKDQEVKEDYEGRIYKHNNCVVEIANGHQAVKPEVFKEDITSSKVSLMIYVDTLSEIIDRCSKNKIEIAVEPRHYYWGSLELVIKDPDGFVLVFIAPYTQEESEKIQADESWNNKKDADALSKK